MGAFDVCTNYSPHKYWGQCFNCGTEMMLFCPDGTYSLVGEANHCDPCPSGTWSKDGSVCVYGDSSRGDGYCRSAAWDDTFGYTDREGRYCTSANTCAKR